MPGGDRETFAIEPSPTPELTVEAYSSARHPEFAPMLRELPSLHGAEDRAAVLTNESPDAITAIVVRWTYCDYRNASRSSYVVWDSYFPMGAAKAVATGERRLVTLKEISAPLDVSKPYFTVSAGNHSIHMARDFKVGLDSIVFEGGRLVGHDTHRIGDLVHGRHAAMKWLAEQIMVAETTGEDPDALMTSILEKSVDMGATQANQWRRRLAMLARRHPATAKSWLFLAPPPRFFRQY
jgi:hypothetical protein